MEKLDSERGQPRKHSDSAEVIEDKGWPFERKKVDDSL